MLLALGLCDNEDVKVKEKVEMLQTSWSVYWFTSGGV